ncbi:MAG: rhomboid family intramembrane serine protease [Pirellulales bacterium]|nr:rhomboid family intramembrane serine protease [Pirellulales bacterium]
MRQIGNLANPQQAQRFADYLLTQGITTKLDQHDGAVNIWVREEDQVSRAAQELASFAREPDNERYRGAAPQANALRREAGRREKQFRRNLIDVRKRWSSVGATGRRPVTNALIGISVVLTLLSSFGEGPLAYSLMISKYVAQRYTLGTLTEVWQGQVWRLVTPIFLHLGIGHLVMDMLALSQIGGPIEIRRGSRNYLGLVAVLALASNLAQYLADGPGFGGISGVVFGLFGYLWMKSRFDSAAGLYIDRQNVALILIFGALCLTGWIGPIANWAHGVGLATGMAIGYAPVAWRNLTKR